jgi:acyl-CoA thioesterase I
VNLLILYFASGESFYPGAALLFLLLVDSVLFAGRKYILLRRVAIWIALASMVMASPPFPWIVDAIFAAIFLFWVVSLNRAGNKWTGLRIGAACVLIALLGILTAAEFRQRRLPVIHAGATRDLVVLGDSISAGLGGRGPSWPEILQRNAGVGVKNLSQAGANMTDGLAMADRVEPQDRLILVELGGNDLISGESADVFGQALESILKKLTVPGRTVVMFELPLLPQMIRYGQIQRRLARKYGVALIPKRYFVSILSGRDATSDGLHLTEVGARRMAALVAKVFSFGDAKP